jgi:hypothetical protein
VPSSLIAALAVALVHAFTHKLRLLDGIPRSRWLSVAGGVSVAYVLLHLLPELAEHQETLGEADWTGGIHHVVYLLTLAGLLTFYGFERASRLHADRTPMDEPEENSGDTPSGSPSSGDDASGDDAQAGSGAERSLYRVHLILFSIYSLIVGYVLAEDSYAGRELALFAVTMVLHFVVVDKSLAETFEQGWERVGRWVMAASVVAGWSLGVLIELPHEAFAGVNAFLGGAVILNVLKEELPEERESRFGAFVGGAVAYALLLMWL